MEPQEPYQRRHLQKPWQPTRDRLLQYQWRAFESQCWPELNRQWWFAREGVIVSRYVAGRPATLDETRGLYDLFRRTQRGYRQDLTTSNAPCDAGRLAVITRK